MRKFFKELVSDEKDRASSTRFCMILGVIVGSVVVVYMALQGTLTEGIFAIYMLATGGVYGLGKWGDTITQKEQIRSTTEPSTINIPGADKVNVKGDNVNVSNNS